VLERLWTHPDVAGIEVCHDPPTVIVTQMDERCLRWRGQKSLTRVALAALAAFFPDDA
jgi:hypothetical protein